MEGTVVCKYCNGEALHTWLTGPLGVEEQCIRCDCGYSYEFLYGYYFEQIPGEPAMTWSYNNPERVAVPKNDYNLIPCPYCNSGGTKDTVGAVINHSAEKAWVFGQLPTA